MAEDRPLRLLALGDSLTAGFGLPAEAAFPVQLQRALAAEGRDVVVLNAGVSGDTSAGGRSRLDWALADKPDAVIVELGANDGLRGIDPAELYANLNAILTRLHQAGLPVLLAGMLAPPNYGRDYAERFAAVYPRLAREHKAVFYPFFLEGVAGQRGMNQGDGLHPTAQGVGEIVRRILPATNQLLDQAQRKPKG